LSDPLNGTRLEELTFPQLLLKTKLLAKMDYFFDGILKNMSDGETDVLQAMNKAGLELKLKSEQKQEKKTPEDWNSRERLLRRQYEKKIESLIATNQHIQSKFDEFKAKYEKEIQQMEKRIKEKDIKIQQLQEECEQQCKRELLNSQLFTKARHDPLQETSESSVVSTIEVFDVDSRTSTPRSGFSPFGTSVDSRKKSKAAMRKFLHSSSPQLNLAKQASLNLVLQDRKSRNPKSESPVLPPISARETRDDSFPQDLVVKKNVLKKRFPGVDSNRERAYSL